MTTTESDTNRDAVVDRLVENFDHHDPAIDNDVYQALRHRFAGCPVTKTTAQGGFALVTRYDDVLEVSKCPAIFSSAKGVLHPSHDDRPKAIPIEFDPPLHTEYRKLFMDVLAAPKVREIEPYLRELTDRLLDEYVAGDDDDFVQHVAVQLPIRAVGYLLGFSEEANEVTQQYAEEILENFGTPKMIEAMGKCAAYAQTHLDDRRANPRDDYLTKLVHADFGGRKLTDEELTNIVRTFMFAGFETTARAIASLVHHLAVHPELQHRLREDPTAINNTVEEGLRVFQPVNTMFRTVLEDTELDGVKLEQGERLAIMYGAANVDPSEFPNPDTFDIDRPNVRQHVAFGIGTHYCAGAPLARAEMRILLEALAARPMFELAGEVRWLPHLMMGQMMGVDYLPLRFADD